MIEAIKKRFEAQGFVDMAGQRILPDDGATLSIGPSGLTAIVQLSDPLESEIAAIRRGAMELAVLGSGATGIVFMRFAAEGGKPPVDFEMPFHVGLLPPEDRRLPERRGDVVHGLAIVLQDQNGHGHGVRMVGPGGGFSEAIERLVERQRVEASSPGWTRRSHDREVEDFYRRYPDLAKAADRIFARALARTTIH